MAPLPSPRHEHGCVVCGDAIYCVGPGQQLLRYDVDDDAWVRLPPPPREVVKRPLCLAHKRKLYVFGRPNQVYDVRTNSWQELPLVHNQLFRRSTAGCSFGDQLFVVGGKTLGSGPETILSATEVYSPNTNSARYAARLNVPRKAFCCCIVPSCALAQRDDDDDADD